MKRNPVASAARRMLVALSLVISLGAGLAQAGSLKHTVAPVDLKQLSPDAMLELKPAEDAVARAQEELRTAQTNRDGAKAQVDEAKRSLASKKESVNAAGSEMAASELAGDQNKLAQAKKERARRKLEVKAAEAHVDWAKLHQDWTKEVLKQAKVGLALREAELELARVQLLGNKRMQAAENYAVVPFRKQVDTIREEYDKLARAAQKTGTKVNKAKAKEDKLAKKATEV